MKLHEAYYHVGMDLPPVLSDDFRCKDYFYSISALFPGRRHRGCLREPGTPRLTKYPFRHPKLSYDFYISSTVLALPDLTLAPSYASLSTAGPCAQNLVATPLVVTL